MQEFLFVLFGFLAGIFGGLGMGGGTVLIPLFRAGAKVEPGDKSLFVFSNGADCIDYSLQKWLCVHRRHFLHIA